MGRSPQTSAGGERSARSPPGSATDALGMDLGGRELHPARRRVLDPMYPPYRDLSVGFLTEKELDADPFRVVRTLPVTVGIGQTQIVESPRQLVGLLSSHVEEDR